MFLDSNLGFCASMAAARATLAALISTTLPVRTGLSKDGVTPESFFSSCSAAPPECKVADMISARPLNRRSRKRKEGW